MAIGLTTEGLISKIKGNRLTLSQDEAIDLFFIYPGLVNITWEKGAVTSVKIDGLNLEFSIIK